jgi:hypothetical protein
MIAPAPQTSATKTQSVVLIRAIVSQWEDGPQIARGRWATSWREPNRSLNDGPAV